LFNPLTDFHSIELMAVIYTIVLS